MIKSVSIFRGQSLKGVGEGPGEAVSYGEQYLAYTEGFPWTASFAAAIRPFLTLDADSSDHHALGGKLTGWSLFEEQGYLGVARQGSAPSYSSFDQRPAYFAHGRFYRLAELERSGAGRVDPGLLLGEDAAFDAPWPPEAWPETRPTSGEPGLLGPSLEQLLERRAELVKAHKDAAVLLLGNLLQARTRGLPLIVAVSALDMAQGAPLPRLLGFARAALPASLRSGLRLRIYELNPRKALKHQGVNLLVIRERDTTLAVEAAPDSIVLGPRGERVRGEKLTATAEAYAREVTARFCAAPGGLPAFSIRVDHLWQAGGGALSMPLLSSLTLCYNLAFASEHPEYYAGLIKDYIVGHVCKKGAAPLPWSRLMPPGDDGPDWPQLSLADLRTLVLEAPEEVVPLLDVEGDPAPDAPAALRLLAAHELVRRRSAGQETPLDHAVLERLGQGRAGVDWFAYLRRLGAMGLISEGTLAAASSGLGLGDLAQRPLLLLAALDLEARVLAPTQTPGQAAQPVIAARGSTPTLLRDLLVQAFAEPSSDLGGPLLALLVQASARGHLHPLWALQTVQSAPSALSLPLVGRLLLGWAEAEQRRQQPGFDMARVLQLPPEGAPDWNLVWDRLLTTALKALHDLGSDPPPAMQGPLRACFEILEVPVYPQEALLATVLLCRLHPSSKDQTIARFWNGASQVAAAGRTELLRQVLASPHPALLLFSDTQDLLIPEDWLPEAAPLLVMAPDLRSRLRPDHLLTLHQHLALAGHPPEPGLWDYIDGVMRQRTDPARRIEMVGALVRHDAYAVWRLGSRTAGMGYTGTRAGDPALCRELALLWLTHDLWQEEVRAPAIDTWKVVLADLKPRVLVEGQPGVGGLDHRDVEGLFDQGQPRFPLIRFRELEQYRDLCACCTDLGALAALADYLGGLKALGPSPPHPNPLDIAMQAADGLPPEIRPLSWPLLALLSRVYPPGIKRLNPEHHTTLLLMDRHAGGRRELFRSQVLKYLHDRYMRRTDDPLTLSELAGPLDLFVKDKDLTLLRWVCEHLGKLGVIPDWPFQVLKAIDRALAEAWTDLPRRADSPTNPSLGEHYRRRSLESLARYFGSATQARPSSTPTLPKAPQPPAGKTFKQIQRTEHIQKFLYTLCVGRGQAEYFPWILDAARRALGSREPTLTHPLDALVEQVRIWLRELDDAHRETLLKNVWPALAVLLKEQADSAVLVRALPHGPGPRRTLPLMDLFLTCSTLTISQFFEDLRAIPKSLHELRDPAWWAAFFGSIEETRKKAPNRSKDFEVRLLDNWRHEGNHFPFADEAVQRAFDRAQVQPGDEPFGSKRDPRPGSLP